MDKIMLIFKGPCQLYMLVADGAEALDDIAMADNDNHVTILDASDDPVLINKADLMCAYIEETDIGEE